MGTNHRHIKGETTRTHLSSHCRVYFGSIWTNNSKLAGPIYPKLLKNNPSRCLYPPRFLLLHRGRLLMPWCARASLDCRRPWAGSSKGFSVLPSFLLHSQHCIFSPFPLLPYSCVPKIRCSSSWDGSGPTERFNRFTSVCRVPPHKSKRGPIPTPDLGVSSQ